VTPNRQPISLDEALENLGPERASEDFTRRVLDGLDHRRHSRMAGLSPRRVATLATLAAIGLALGFWLRSHPAVEPEVQENSARLLRQEYLSLQSEVAALRSLAAQPPPVLYLGGDSQVDLVLDLGQSGFEPPKLDIRPLGADSQGVEPQFRRTH